MSALPRFLAPRAPAVAAEARAFQTEIDALVDAPVPVLLRAWPFLIGALVAALLLAAALTRIDVVVAASGRLTADEPPVVLQPAGSAVLRELRVRPGATVAAGQVVAVLDQTFTEADRAALEAQRAALTARRDRLAAERAGPAAFATAAGGSLEDALRQERAALLAARRRSLDAELAATHAAQASEAQAGSTVRQQLEVMGEIEAMRSRLADAGSGSRLNLLEARSARLGAEEELRRHHARLDELAQQEVAKTAEIAALERDWERQILEELASIGPDLARIEEQLQKAARLDALTALTAPRAGIVLDVAQRAPGSLMREGEPVVTLVPTDVPLIAEIALRSADVGRLAPGAPAVLKIDAFPWRRHGMLEGRLRAVSRESYSTEGGMAGLHRGQVMIDPATGGQLADGSVPLPGMTLSAELKVGTRSVLDFFLDPLMRGLEESLREP